MASNFRRRAAKNLSSAAGEILVATTNVASKGAEKGFKWMATDHTASSTFHDYESRVMEESWNRNFAKVGKNYTEREFLWLMWLNERKEKAGKQITFLDIVLLWILRVVLAIFEGVWAFCEPLLTYLFLALFRLVILVGLYIVWFAFLFWVVYEIFTH